MPLLHDVVTDDVVTVRPTQREDFSAIAQLLIQLYAVELPGALHGPRVGQERLLQFTLAAKQAQGLQGRYVATNTAGEIVATATLEYPGASRYDRAPDGTLRQALALIGYGATARLLFQVAKSLVEPPRPRTPDVVWCHSLVVDEDHRGQGIGRILMTTLEQQAVMDGFAAIWLQVLAMNHPARTMYRQLGYTEMWSTPLWQQLLT